MIDHEHGAFDLDTIADLAGWFQATNVSAIVRIHKSFTYLIPAILDQGIMGIQVSEVGRRGVAASCRRISADRQSRHLGAGMHTGYGAMAPVTRPSMRRGPMPTSSSACRSNRSRA
jgi:2-keto-3-deoxy-L-rhamnonate aldolase RhmA